MIPIAYGEGIDRPRLAMIFSAPRGPTLAREAVAMERWSPKQDPTRQEEFILKRLEKRKLFGFLRRHRHELFDDAFQSELELMYRDTDAGVEPVPPAQLAMALLLQGYLGLSDWDAVETAVMDLRWQMVLGCLGAEEPPFSQGTLQSFRERLIAHDMDRRLLERTVELAKSTKEFDWKKLPKTLRVAIDSAPREGAGRVEDTINLLAHAARKVVECVADLLDWTPDRVCRESRAPLRLGPSVKRHWTVMLSRMRARQAGCPGDVLWTGAPLHPSTPTADWIVLDRQAASSRRQAACSRDTGQGGHFEKSMKLLDFQVGMPAASPRRYGPPRATGRSMTFPFRFDLVTASLRREVRLHTGTARS